MRPAPLRYGDPPAPAAGDAATLRLLAVNAAVRRCPHRTASSCAGLARCALGRGRNGRVTRTDCEMCVAPAVDAAAAEAAAAEADPETSAIADVPGAELPSNPVVFDADDRPLRLANTRSGRAVALFCGGPSLATLDLGPFMAPWVDRAAVNNAGALVRPHWWACVDHPEKFHPGIWSDPNCWKFCCRNHRRHRVRRKLPGGSFAPDGRVAADCPSVAFYRRHRAFDHESWLPEETLSWGSSDDRECSLGLRGGRSVLFVMLKLLLVVGYRRVFLLGCDWHMDPAGPQYGFAQAKDERACASNNRSYATNGRRLAALRPALGALGVEVVNATPGSRLDAFARCSPAEALAAIEAANRADPDLAGWY